MENNKTPLHIVYDYINRADIISNGIKDALNYVYSISYPLPDKTFTEICDELEKERISVKGNRNWRKMYGSYQWPIDFYYIPKKVLEEVWENQREAHHAICDWQDNLKTLKEFLFDTPGIKDVYKDDINGNSIKTIETQPLLKDIIGEEASEKVKNIIDEYIHTYKFGISDYMAFAGAFLSTPTCNKETVINAWKTAFDIDIEIPDDTAWIDVYEYNELNDKNSEE